MMSSIGGNDRQSIQAPGAGPGKQAPASPQQALDPQTVQRDLSTLLERAGLERAPDGTVTVKDSAALGRAGEVQGLSAREQVYGSGATQLRPPGPPKIEMNKEMRTGAETFARNIDVAFNNIFLRAGATPLTAGAPGAVAGPNATQSDEIRRLAELSADVLLAAFLKINISDPNNSVETHNKLHEIMTDLRQKAIDDARAKIETSRAQMKEAQEYAEQAKIISTVLQVVMIALTLFLTFITFGAGAPLLFVAAAMVVGAIAGQATTGDALGGASLAGSLASFGVSTAPTLFASEATKAAANAAALAVQEGAKEAATNAVKETVKEAVKETLKQGKEVTQKLLDDAGKTALQKIKDQGIKATEETLRTSLETGMKQGTQEAFKEAGKAVPQSLVNSADTMGKSTLSTLAEDMKAMGKEVADSFVKEAMFAGKTMDPSTFRFALTSAQAASSVTQSGANTKAGDMALQAQQSQVEAKRARHRAEMFQDQLQEQSEIVKMIMESKNQVVDAVIKMMNAMFASSQKLMSAGMAKG